MRLDGFGLLVEDMAKMVRFYRDVMGWLKIWRKWFAFIGM